MGGIFSLLKRSMANEWSTNNMLRLKRVHIYFGYLMFLWVQIAICTGIMTRVINANQTVGKHSAVWYISLNVILIVTVMAVHEYSHRKFLK